MVFKLASLKLVVLCCMTLLAFGKSSVKVRPITPRRNLQGTPAELTRMATKPLLKNSYIAESLSEGNLSEDPPSYYRLNGNNGLRLKISRPANKHYDYTIMFWMRSNLNHEELFQKYFNTSRVLFDTKTFKCSIFVRSAVRIYLYCNPDSEGFKINIARFADIKGWMHITWTTNIRADQATLRVDAPTTFIERTAKYTYKNRIRSQYMYFGMD